MSLCIYEQTSPGVYAAFSVDGEFTNPITTVHNGQTGDTFELELFVRADDTNSYTNIQVKALSTEEDIGSGSSPGDTGWGIKLLVDPGYTPAEEDWDAVSYGTAIGIADIVSSSTTYRAFYLRIESPRSISVKNKQNISLYILSTES